jgi:hypothetical protein
MKKIILAPFAFLFALSLLADWQNPLVQSKIEMSFTQKKTDETRLWQHVPAYDFFALSSLRKSVGLYFSKDDEHLFYSFKKKRQWVTLSLFTGLDYTEDYYITYHGMKIAGKLAKSLSFYTDWWKGHISGYDDIKNAQNSDLMDSWYQTSDDKKKIYLDNLKARMLWQSDYGDYALGRETKSIGNNIGGSIILNDDCNEYGFLSANWKLGNIGISLLHATLIPDSASTELPKFNDKFLATHILKWNINANWQLFLGEHIIYGNRNLDLNYLLPLAFYRVIEHNLADRDNALIFGGFNFHFSDHTFYTNFILDEFKKSEILGNWWGNKYAVQTGASFSFANFFKRFGIEITAVRPWLYTHYILENKFSHDGISLGFPDGSNLVQTTTEIELDLRKNLSLVTQFSYTVQGSVGNSFSINYETREKDTANWLEGTKTDTKQLNATLDWQPLAHHCFKISNSFMKINSQSIETELRLGYYTYF